MGISKPNRYFLNHCSIPFNNEARNAHSRRSRPQICPTRSLSLGSCYAVVPRCSQTSPVGKYNGPGGCASSSCHGSIQPKQITHVSQNEYSIWAGQDKHARAYQVLSNDVSLRIGRILNLKSPPEQNQKCLACHALSVAAEQARPDF